MEDFAKRPLVTVTTMGKFHNPTGEEVPAVPKNIPASTNNSKLSDNRRNKY